MIENRSRVDVVNYVGALIFIAGLGSGLRYVYYHVVEDLFSTLFIEEYNYLLIVIPLFFILLSLRIRNAVIMSEARLSRILVSVTLILTAIIFNLLSTILVDYMLILQVLSMVFYVWSLTIILYSKVGLKELLLPLLALALIVPVPREIMDLLILRSLNTIMYLVSAITSTKPVTCPNNLMTTCSGISGMGLLLALTPILIHLSRKTTLRRRVLAVLTGLAIGFIVAFLGSVLRTSLILWFIQSHKASTILEMVRYTSSAILAISTLAVAVLVVVKITGKGKGSLSTELSKESVSIEDGYKRRLWPLSIFVIVLVLLSIGIVYIQFTNILASNELRIRVYPYSYVESNISSILFAGNVEIADIEDDAKFMVVPSSDLVKIITIKYGGRLIQGLIEFAETPLRFHEWRVNLAWRGYSILASWREELKGSTITFISYKDRIGKNYLLGYTIYPLQVLINGKVDRSYIRLTLFMETNENYMKATEYLRKVFTQGVNQELHREELGNRRIILQLLVNIEYWLIITIIAYYVIIFGYSLVNKTLNPLRKVVLRRRSL